MIHITSLAIGIAIGIIIVLLLIAYNRANERARHKEQLSYNLNKLKAKQSFDREMASKALDALCWHPQDNDADTPYYYAAKRDWTKTVDYGDAAVPPLQIALEDSQKEIRQQAARALAKLGTRNSYLALQAVLQKRQDRLGVCEEEIKDTPKEFYDNSTYQDASYVGSGSGIHEIEVGWVSNPAYEQLQNEIETIRFDLVLLPALIQSHPCFSQSDISTG